MACEKCTRWTTDPRRGLCERCYMIAYRAQVRGEACASCGYADLRVLVQRTFADEVKRTLCANCATILGRRPLTLRELTREVRPPGDRREVDRRRGDRRVPKDRRERVDVSALADDKRGTDRRKQ